MIHAIAALPRDGAVKSVCGLIEWQSKSHFNMTRDPNLPRLEYLNPEFGLFGLGQRFE